MPSADFFFGRLAKIATRPSLAVAPGDDGYLVFDIQAGRVYHLNPTAALVFELSDGTRTLDEIRAALAPIIGDEKWPDARAWIARALREGPLRRGAAPAVDERLTDPEKCAALVKSLRSEGDLLAAFVCQHYLTEMLPEDADAWYRLGDLAQGLGRRQDARAAYERYRDLLTEPDVTIDMILVSLRGDEPPPRASDVCVKQLFESFSKTYDDHMVQRLYFKAPELLLNAIKKARPELTGANILDLGCGTGLHGALLRPLARRLTGVDLSEEMSEKARARGIYDELLLEEITAYFARDLEPFDHISACDVLIYFGDLRQVLRPAAKHIKPGALFGFTVEAGDTAPFKLTDSGRFAHHRSHIADAAADSGFSVVSIDDAVLRDQYGEPVKGLVNVLRRN